MVDKGDKRIQKRRTTRLTVAKILDRDDLTGLLVQVRDILPVTDSIVIVVRLQSGDTEVLSNYFDIQAIAGLLSQGLHLALSEGGKHE